MASRAARDEMDAVTPLERAVIAFVEREVPWPRPKQIQLDMDLRGRLRMVWEDADALLAKFFEEFAVDSTNFQFGKYFPTPRYFLLNLGKTPEPEPLTLRMLADAAQRGGWPA